MVDFVSNPSIGDEKEINSKLFRWDGEKWGAVREVRPKEVSTVTAMMASNKTYSVGTFVEMIGYSNVFDRGYGYWVRIDETGAASQSPSSLLNAKFTTAKGETFEYVDNLGYLNLCAIGAVGDGSFDNDSVFEAACNSRFLYHKLFGGIYLCSTYTMETGFCLEGIAGDRPVLRLKEAGNKTVLYGEDVMNITIRDLVVDGNKSSQTIGASNNWRGIYFLGDCSNINIENVTVKNVVDHGIFFSNGSDVSNRCGRDSTVTNVIVTNCGSEAHISAGGAGGTGFVGGQRSTHFVSCVAYGNYLNGFKSNGTHTGCESYSNVGGGYETGFGSPETTQAKWVQCSAENNGGTGWRNQGEGDELTWVGCLARGNGRAGILLLNSVKRANIESSWFIENGQKSYTETRSDTEGYDGITITGTSVTPNDIQISGCQFHDDQDTKTQEYHIYMRKQTPNVTISDDNVFGDVKIQPFLAEVDASSSNLKIGKCFGLSTYVNNTSPVTITGTTSVTDLTNHSINARSLLSSTRLRLTVVGNVSGTLGAKTIKLRVGATTIDVASLTAPDEVAYYLEAEIVRHVSTAYVKYVCYIEGQAQQEGMFTSSASFSNALSVRTMGELGNAADSITQQRFTLEQV
ncbi:tailspike protein [Alteromonas phage ZP6]|uniref:Uncharacterized protein n=1 Tax=Alteromonas phage ZP6 TaxID=2492447 RepID=A0A7D7KH48_9CAUD|nr:tailspike protein [Alteromonas phage ZP6]QMS42070.1 tailspike protein [Alteromonas phage ZP6]